MSRKTDEPSLQPNTAESKPVEPVKQHKTTESKSSDDKRLKARSFLSNIIPGKSRVNIIGKKAEAKSAVSHTAPVITTDRKGAQQDGTAKSVCNETDVTNGNVNTAAAAPSSDVSPLITCSDKVSKDAMSLDSTNDLSTTGFTPPASDVIADEKAKDSPLESTENKDLDEKVITDDASTVITTEEDNKENDKVFLDPVQVVNTNELVHQHATTTAAEKEEKKIDTAIVSVPVSCTFLSACIHNFCITLVFPPFIQQCVCII